MKWSRLVVVLALSCASGSRVPAARFANTPIVSVVNDRLDVAKPPSWRRFLPILYFFDGTVQRRLTRALELPRHQRALGVNAIDEVADSTWFTNRIGVRALSPDEIRRGPVTDNPELHRPWTIRGTKVGGTSVGFIIKDARGVKYMLKFDALTDPPELQTATHVAVNRLLWASGYNVAEDQIVYFRREDLRIAPDAKIKDHSGDEVGRFDERELDRELKLVHVEPDGSYRSMASRWIEGTTLGGHPGEGVRGDDPNDLIPHELRRDLRGFYAICAWLDHVDVTEGQFVDAWTTDDADRRRHYVRHFAIDFGMSLGAMGTIMQDLRRGYTYEIDIVDIVRAIATGGIPYRRWEHREAPPIRGVAPLFVASTFDPGNWHPDLPGYTPFLESDRFDKFWGAKIVSSFTREQIHAAVEAGKFTDARAVDYITDTLVARQKATEAYWYARVNPLAGFMMKQDGAERALCFDDLAITDGLVAAGTTRYMVTTFDFAAQPLASAVDITADRRGRTCIAGLTWAPGDDRDGYAIIRIATKRSAFSGETYVHVAREPGGTALRVIGLWRP